MVWQLLPSQMSQCQRSVSLGSVALVFGHAYEVPVFDVDDRFRGQFETVVADVVEVVVSGVDADVDASCAHDCASFVSDSE